MAQACATEALVELTKVSKHFGEGETRVDALRDVSIAVAPGEIVGLVGPSGSGKSTLLNVVACILEPSSGRMRLDGVLVYDNRWLKGDLRKLRLDKIGFIFQFHNLLPFLNTMENVAIVLELAGVTSADAKRRAVELLDYLGVGNRKNAMPSTVSGGEAQRVAIGRALLCGPRFLLMDEPLSSLDLPRRAEIVTVIERIRDELKLPILYVSHDSGEVERLAAAVVRLAG